MSKTWCLGMMPRSFMRSSILHRAAIKSPSVLFLVVSTSDQLMSMWRATTWYCCPWLYQTGNFPVWSVYIVSFVSYTAMKRSCFVSTGSTGSSGTLFFVCFQCTIFIVGRLSCLAAPGGPYYLLLVAHVPLLCFLRFGEMFVHIIDIY